MIEKSFGLFGVIMEGCIGPAFGTVRFESAPPIAATVQVSQSFPATATSHVGFDLGHAPAHIGKIDALVSDHPWLHLFLQPPWITEGKSNIEPTASEFPPKPRAGID